VLAGILEQSSLRDAGANPVVEEGMNADRLQQAAAPDLAGIKVLVAEDEAVQALDLATILGEFGCRVVGPTSSVVAAMDLLSKDRPDLALLDVRLQDGSVEPLAEKLAAVDVPFALVTGYGGTPFAHPLLNQAPRLDKPYGILELGEQVHRLFRAHIEQRLAHVELQLVQTEERIARQAETIQRLTRRGQDASVAEAQRQGMEQSLELMRAHRSSLLREQIDLL
jgi:DNA-binding LytR/AlgR family response regulator